MANIPLSQVQLRDYQCRWEAVALREREELRATPLAEKLRQLSALFDFGRTLDWGAPSSRGEDEARERWNRLRRAWHGR